MVEHASGADPDREGALGHQPCQCCLNNVWQPKFVIGEAVIRGGVDGISDKALLLATDGDDLSRSSAFDPHGQSDAAAGTLAEWDIRRPVRARRDRPRPTPRRMPNGTGGLGIEASRPPV